MEFKKLVLVAALMTAGSAIAADHSRTEKPGSFEPTVTPSAHQPAASSMAASSTNRPAASASTDGASVSSTDGASASSTDGASASSSNGASASSSNGASASDSSMSGGQAGDESVRQLQQALKDKGFYSGSIDGILGPRTQAAIDNAKQVNADIPGLSSAASASASSNQASSASTNQPSATSESASQTKQK